MAIALTATPLPDQAAVRLRLDSVVGYNTVIWDYSVGTATSNAAEASSWDTTGSIYVNGQSGRLLVQTAVSDGSNYATFHLSALAVGQRYTVNVWVDGLSSGNEVRLSRGATAFRSIYSSDYASAQPSAGIGATLLTYEFVASATTEDVRLTPYNASFGTSFSLLGLSVRNVPTARFKFMQDITANDAANWSLSTLPTNGASSGLNNSALPWPSGVSGNTLVTEFRSTGANTATYAAGTTGFRRTVTGLTVGQRYRVNLLASAQVQSFGTGATTTPLRLAAGVQGIGSGTPGTGRWLTYEFTATATSHVVTVLAADTFTASGGTGSTRQVAVIRERGMYVEDVYATLTDAYTLKSLTRSDANGTRTVRLYEGQGLSDGVLVTTDPEPAFTGLLLYTAVVRDVVGATDVTVTASTTLEGSITRSRIAPASLPSQGQWYDLAPDMTVGRESTSTTAQVINRADPLVTLGTQTLRRGTLSVFCETYAMGADLEAVFNRGEVVLVRQPDHPGLDMYVVGVRTSLQIQPELTDPRRWVLEVEYTEVAAPTTPLRGSIGWTIAESMARNATLAASRAEFPTVLDLLIGPNT